MNEVFSIGQRVKIIDKRCGFPQEATGIISYPPKVSIIYEDFGDNYFREVRTLKGNILSFWVKFDIAQYDSDGDGPYEEGEIETIYLEAL